ncbi:hypothetical protein Tco_1335088 [Tanacetum coccineum]
MGCMIRAKLEVNTVRLKKLVLLAEVSAASRVSTASRNPLAWAVDFFRLQEPDSPEAALASPDYVPGPKELEQAPLSPNYVLGPEYLEYLAPSDEEVPVEDQPYVLVDSPIAYIRKKRKTKEEEEKKKEKKEN